MVKTFIPRENMVLWFLLDHKPMRNQLVTRKNGFGYEKQAFSYETTVFFIIIVQEIQPKHFPLGKDGFDQAKPTFLRGKNNNLSFLDHQFS